MVAPQIANIHSYSKATKSWSLRGDEYSKCLSWIRMPASMVSDVHAAKKSRAFLHKFTRQYASKHHIIILEVHLAYCPNRASLRNSPTSLIPRDASETPDFESSSSNRLESALLRLANPPYLAFIALRSCSTGFQLIGGSVRPLFQIIPPSIHFWRHCS